MPTFRSATIGPCYLPDDDLRRIGVTALVLLGGRSLVHDSRAIRRRTQDLLPRVRFWLPELDHHLRDHLVDEKVVEFIEGQENVT